MTYKYGMRLYNFRKPRNSTKRLSAEQYYNGILHDCGYGYTNPPLEPISGGHCVVRWPWFEVTSGNADYDIIPGMNIWNASYLVIYQTSYPPTQGADMTTPVKYFFVENVTVEGELCTLELTEDLLAEYADQLFNEGQYISRGFRNRYGSTAPAYQIPDSTLFAKLDTTYATNEMSLPWLAGSYDNCTFVLGIKSGGDQPTGLAWYVMQRNGYQKIMDRLYSGNLLTMIENSVFSIQDYIQAAYLYPFPISSVSSSAVESQYDDDTKMSTIVIGYEVLELNAVIYQITDPTFMPSFDFNFPTPAVTTKQNIIGEGEVDLQWLAYAPYASYQAFIPPFGHLELPYPATQGRVKIDMQAGVAILEIFGQLQNRLMTVSAPFGIQTGLMTSQIDITKIISSGGSIAQSVLKENPVGAAVGAVNLGLSFLPSVSGAVNAQGSLASYYSTAYATTISKKLSSYGATPLGLPVEEYDTLANYHGFCQCRGASLSFAAPAYVIRELENALNTGIYIE